MLNYFSLAEASPIYVVIYKGHHENPLNVPNWSPKPPEYFGDIFYKSNLKKIFEGRFVDQRLDYNSSSNILLTLPMLKQLSSKAQGRKDFENHLNPVMLVFIG